MRLIHLFLINFLILTNCFASSHDLRGFEFSESIDKYNSQLNYHYFDRNESWLMSEGHRDILLQVTLLDNERINKYLKGKYCFELFLDEKMIWTASCAEVPLDHVAFETILKIPYSQQNFKLGYQVLLFETLEVVSQISREQCAQRDLAYNYGKYHPENRLFEIITPNTTKSYYRKPEKIVNFLKAERYSAFDTELIDENGQNLKTLALYFDVIDVNGEPNLINFIRYKYR